MGEGEGLGALEIGKGPCQSEDPVHPTQGEVPAFEGVHEPAAERHAQCAVGPLRVRPSSILLTKQKSLMNICKVTNVISTFTSYIGQGSPRFVLTLEPELQRDNFLHM